MCFLSKNSPHRPTASEPGKSATQAEVDGDYFCYGALPMHDRDVHRAVSFLRQALPRVPRNRIEPIGTAHLDALGVLCQSGGIVSPPQ